MLNEQNIKENMADMQEIPPSLAKMLATRNLDCAAAADEIRAWGENAIPMLLAALGDGGLCERINAAGLLGEIKPDRADVRQALEAASKDANGYIAQAAADALVIVTDTPEKRQAEYEKEVAAAGEAFDSYEAEQALVSIGDSRLAKIVKAVLALNQGWEYLVVRQRSQEPRPGSTDRSDVCRVWILQRGRASSVESGSEPDSLGSGDEPVLDFFVSRDYAHYFQAVHVGPRTGRGVALDITWHISPAGTEFPFFENQRMLWIS